MRPLCVSLPIAGITGVSRRTWLGFIYLFTLFTYQQALNVTWNQARPHLWASPSGLWWFTSTRRASSADLVPQRTSPRQPAQVFTILWLKYSRLWGTQTFGCILSLASMCKTQICRGWADGPVLKVLALQVQGPAFNPQYLPEERKELGVETCAHTPSAEGAKTGRPWGSWDSSLSVFPVNSRLVIGTDCISKEKAKSFWGHSSRPSVLTCTLLHWPTCIYTHTHTYTQSNV